MVKNARVQMIAMLAVGGLLGYAASSGKLVGFRSANARPPESAAGESESSPVPCASGACCSEGATRGQLVAMAAPNAKVSAAAAEANGKKPNIVFIMGDD